MVRDIITITKAAKHVGKSKGYVRGACDALGIELTAVGTALVMTESDFNRLARRMPVRKRETASSTN